MYNHASSSGDVHPTCLGGGIGIHTRLKISRLMAMRVQVPPKAPRFPRNSPEASIIPIFIIYSFGCVPKLLLPTISARNPHSLVLFSHCQSFVLSKNLWNVFGMMGYEITRRGLRWIILIVKYGSSFVLIINTKL